MSAITHKGLVQILRASEGPTPRLCSVAADRIDEYIALIAEHDAMLAEREQNRELLRRALIVIERAPGSACLEVEIARVLERNP